MSESVYYPNSQVSFPEKQKPLSERKLSDTASKDLLESINQDSGNVQKLFHCVVQNLSRCGEQKEQVNETYRLVLYASWNVCNDA